MTVAKMSMTMRAVPKSGCAAMSRKGRPARKMGTKMWRRVRPSSAGVSCTYLARAMMVKTFMSSEGCR